MTEDGERIVNIGRSLKATMAIMLLTGVIAQPLNGQSVSYKLSNLKTDVTHSQYMQFNG